MEPTTPSDRRPACPVGARLDGLTRPDAPSRTAPAGAGAGASRDAGRGWGFVDAGSVDAGFEPPPDCPSWAAMCDGECAELSSDVRHCGACGRACVGAPGELAQCNDGECEFRCGGVPEYCEGMCVDLAVDPRNCGACGNECPAAPNARPICAGAACQLACEAGFADCDREPWNGCETNIASDPAHCGGCFVACPPGLPHTSPVCRGTCDAPCDPGYQDCNRIAADGCEHVVVSGPCQP